MIFLIMSILGNALLFIILKYFDKLNINTLQAIVVNYFTAGSLALYFSNAEFGFTYYFSSGWWYIPLILGSLFISIFLMIAKTAQQVSVTAASVANKMSLVVPVIFAFVVFKDHLDFVKVVGISLALISVYLTSKKEAESTSSVNYVLPLIVFLGSGIIDTIINYTQKVILAGNETTLFISMSFFMAAISGVVVLGIKREFPSTRSLIGGIVLGIPNYFSIYGIMRAIEAGFMETSFLYPINNICIVLVSTVLGIVLLKEKQTVYNWAGISLAVLAILLLSLSIL